MSNVLVADDNEAGREQLVRNLSMTCAQMLHCIKRTSPSAIPCSPRNLKQGVRSAGACRRHHYQRLGGVAKNDFADTLYGAGILDGCSAKLHDDHERTTRCEQ